MKPISVILMMSLAVLLFSGCERDIDLPLRVAADVPVVDASIENGKAPVVVLTKSYNYFSKITLDLLANSFIHQAAIVIRKGSDSVQLKEYSYPVGTARIYYYTIDTTAGTTKMLGQLNSNYNMTIDINGSKYTAQTTIPSIAKTLDSLWYKPAPNNSDTLKRILFSQITDPRGLGNYIRYFTSVNDSAFLPGLTSVYDDDITDGTTYSTQVFKGADKNQHIDINEYGYFKKGDKIIVRFCNIDRATYDFWRTLEYAQQSVGNPFSQPGVVLGNIKGGALGYFGGYAAQYKQIVVNN